VAFAGTLTLLMAAGWTAAPCAASENKSQQDRAASAYVAEALRAEISGENSRRHGLLQAALEEVPDHPAARSQSGYVRSGGRWVKFDEASQSASSDQRL
jgi:hypothetical protein